MMKFSNNFLKLEILSKEELSFFIIDNYEVLPKEVKDISAIYLLEDTSKEIIYIGKAKKLRTRLSSHISKNSKSNASWIPKEIIKKVYFLECNEEEAEMIEKAYIFFYKPKFNNNHNYKIYQSWS